MRRPGFHSFIFGLLLSAMVAVPSVAAAHSPTFYTGGGGKWTNFLSIGYYQKGFPTTTHVARINNGHTQWNAAGPSGIEPDFWYAGTTSTAGNADLPCSATYNGVYWRNLDYLGIGVLGFTPHCENTAGVVTRFSMSIDSNASWYTGTGEGPGGQYDLWSVASHEWGHATGWYGHFASSESICVDNSAQATMCPFIRDGTQRIRTLDTHTIHTFQAAY